MRPLGSCLCTDDCVSPKSSHVDHPQSCDTIPMPAWGGGGGGEGWTLLLVLLLRALALVLVTAGAKAAVSVGCKPASWRCFIRQDLMWVGGGPDLGTFNRRAAARNLCPQVGGGHSLGQCGDRPAAAEAQECQVPMRWTGHARGSYRTKVGVYRAGTLQYTPLGREHPTLQRKRKWQEQRR